MHHHAVARVEELDSLLRFEEFDRLVAAARALDGRAYLLVLMAGEAGLRLGEMVALEWSDIAFVKRQVCVQ
jgi:integrase